MRNWLGQKIIVGDVVGRGARSDNTSEFKLGVVDTIDDKGVKVNWLYRCDTVWVHSGRDKSGTVVGPVLGSVTTAWPVKGSGRPDLNSLFRLRWDDKDYCDVLHSLYQLYWDGLISGEEYLDKMNNIMLYS